MSAPLFRRQCSMKIRSANLREVRCSMRPVFRRNFYIGQDDPMSYTAGFPDTTGRKVGVSAALDSTATFLGSYREDRNNASPSPAPL